jgi:hypothetical protein
MIRVYAEGDPKGDGLQAGASSMLYCRRLCGGRYDYCSRCQASDANHSTNCPSIFSERTKAETRLGHRLTCNNLHNLPTSTEDAAILIKRQVIKQSHEMRCFEGSLVPTQQQTVQGELRIVLLVATNAKQIGSTQVFSHACATRIDHAAHNYTGASFSFIR